MAKKLVFQLTDVPDYTTSDPDTMYLFNLGVEEPDGTWWQDEETINALIYNEDNEEEWGPLGKILDNYKAGEITELVYEIPKQGLTKTKLGQKLAQDLKAAGIDATISVIDIPDKDKTTIVPDQPFEIGVKVNDNLAYWGSKDAKDAREHADPSKWYAIELECKNDDDWISFLTAIYGEQYQTGAITASVKSLGGLVDNPIAHTFFLPADKPFEQKLDDLKSALSQYQITLTFDKQITYQKPKVQDAQAQMYKKAFRLQEDGTWSNGFGETLTGNNNPLNNLFGSKREEPKYTEGVGLSLSEFLSRNDDDLDFPDDPS